MNYNYTKFQELMARTDKLNIILCFDKNYYISSIVFLANQEQYVAVTTYDDYTVRVVSVSKDASILQHLNGELINLGCLSVAYKLNIINGKLTTLYNKRKVSMSLSEIEYELKIAPGSLTIKE